jgi:hypothetical protein
MFVGGGWIEGERVEADASQIGVVDAIAEGNGDLLDDLLFDADLLLLFFKNICV